MQRIINDWFNRLVGAASEGNFSGKEQYAAHRTTRDYIWNSVGLGVWAMTFPLLTVIITQLVGTELAGKFSLAYVVGLLLMFVANYGVRTYQVSDIDEVHAFSDYQINRLITCIVMLLLGIVYSLLRGYESEMFIISMGVYVFFMINGLADTYEGRLQQVSKLYLAGISQTVRSLVVLVLFILSLLIFRSLAIACIVMAVASLLSFVFLTLPLALLESPKSRKFNLDSVKTIFIQCLPLFLAIFLFNLVDSMPRFVMEGVLSYDNQLYFSALYFPAQAILILIQLIYRPQLVRMANLWGEGGQRRKFDLMVIVICLVIIVLTLLLVLLMGSIGLPVMSFLYGFDFEDFRGLCFIMLAAGGITAAIDFIYQAITVIREQRSATRIYLITFVFSLFVPILLMTYAGLEGIVLSYLIVMSILCVLLVVEFFSIRYRAIRESIEADREEHHRRLTPEERSRRKRLQERREAWERKNFRKHQ